MRLVALSLCFLAANAPAHAVPAAATPDTVLHQLFETEWERGLRENPLLATYLGDRRYEDRWPDLSPAALARSDAADRAALEALASIPPDSLSESDRLNQRLFRRMVQGQLDEFAWGLQYLPITQRDGVQSVHELAELLPFATVRDYEDWIARLNGLGPYVDQTIDLMREGMRRGLVQPRVTMERVPAQIARQVVDDPAESPFFGPFANMPQTIPAAEQQRLRTEALRAIELQVVPSYRRLQQFFTEEYLPATRDTVGIWDTPGGADWYQQRIRWFTTTELTADEIHAIGLREVARIRAEMQKVIDRVGFKGSFEEFLHFLRTDPQFRYTDPQQLLQAYQVMAKRIDPLLPAYFGRLPRMPYGVRPIPAESAPDTTTAYYQGPALDGRRAGYYYVNLYKPEERPTYEIPVLSIHEAVPGHHLQIALAQELGEQPKFRRDLEVTAFIEGWALYSESLGEEMGLYTDPYDKFGQLTYEMWRAVRLVVDTGLHHKRWTREQAIEFFTANAAKSEHDIVNEIDRYISLARTGARLQDRRAPHQGAARARDGRARAEVRPARVPRRRARQRRGAARRARGQRDGVAGRQGRRAESRRGAMMSTATRRHSTPVRVGHVTVGGGHPVVVQSMTNTDTADVEATALQVRALAKAGSELVRVTVNTDEAAAAVPRIVDRLGQFGVHVPIVGDFHFNGHKLLREHPACAEALAKYRINPGNVGPRQQARPAVRRDDRDRLPPRQTGAHRRQLGQPRPGPADAPDGRELAACRAARSERRDARSHRRLGARERGARRGTRPRPRPDRDLVQGERRAGPDRRLSQYRGTLRLPAAPRPDRGRHGLEGHRRLDRGDGCAAAGGHRRHDPRVADARARR